MARLFTIADPQLSPMVHGAVQRFRAQHDPQHRLLGPHITLEFGASALPPDVYAATVGAVAARQRAFGIAVGSARAWAAPDGTQFLFLCPDEGAAALSRLHADLAGALGLAPASQPFDPHITVGRAATQAGAQAALACLPAGMLSTAGRIDGLLVGALDGDRFTVLQRCPLRSD